ncbi:hypothetical protein [Stenotrophomonas maltophilia]|uniref:hypothetical protein n=1 Tax=Stenotrophomonas maltophilia TaxID=40324 RepID=UPI000D0CB6B1|nr:hypothetical protein [Stenotrophomonas maltophilia]PSM14122.1 hypothetical protein CV100_08230 [Stenotrophomonas maltophilia]
MDHDVKYEFQQLQLRVANAERNIEHTAGRVLALQAALTAALNSWGKDPSLISAEVNRIFDEVAAEAPRLQMPVSAMNAFRDLRTKLTVAIETTAAAP